MIRFILTIILVASTLIALPAANAVTDGCPDTWVIDTSSAQGLTELLQVKQKLGVEMALSDGIFEFSDFAGALGPMREPIKKAFDEEDLFLYGKTQVFQTYTVAVRNCPTRALFKFSKGALDKFLTLREIAISESKASAWASSNQDAFTDFTQINGFSQCLDNIVRSITTNFQDSFKLNSRRPYQQSQWQSQLRSSSGGYLLSVQPSPCGLNTHGFLGIQLTEGCKLILRNSPRGNIFGANVKTGSKCDFGIAIFERDRGSGRIASPEVVILNKFSLDTRSTSVICVKGKVIKNIAGSNSKCPKGYKKK